MKTERFYFILLGILILVFVLVQVLKPTPLDWSESFSANHKKPYGGYIIHNLLEPVFSNQEIQQNNKPIFEYTDTSEAVNWLFINNNFTLDEWETNKLLSQVAEGSNLFIAARNYGGEFADTLNLETKFGNPLLGGDFILQDDTTNLYFTNPALQRDGGWPYYQSTTETFFSSVDTAKTIRLGTNSEGHANFIKIHWGEGNIYLHSNPTLFTNYFVRNKTGADYALSALSYLPEQKILWDEYYKAGRSSAGGPVRYIVSQKHLKWAWFLSLSGVILFMIFKAKRTQRIIPVIKPPKNSSIEFAKTIGSLYLEKGHHKKIADKKIRFFLDYIRTNLGLETAELNASLRKNTAQRSGIDEVEIQELFDGIESVSQKDKISQQELKQLTDRIDRFYKNSLR